MKPCYGQVLKQKAARLAALVHYPLAAAQLVLAFLVPRLIQLKAGQAVAAGHGSSPSRQITAYEGSRPIAEYDFKPNLTAHQAQNSRAMKRDLRKVTKFHFQWKTKKAEYKHIRSTSGAHQKHIRSTSGAHAILVCSAQKRLRGDNTASQGHRPAANSKPTHFNSTAKQ